MWEAIVPSLVQRRIQTQRAEKVAKLYASLPQIVDGKLVRKPGSQLFTLRDALAAEHRDERTLRLTPAAKQWLDKCKNNMHVFGDDAEEVPNRIGFG